jgi:hypothetical protein
VKPELPHLLLAGVTVTGLALGTRLVARPLVRVELPQREIGQLERQAAPPVPTTEFTIRVIVVRDPFSIRRRPAPLAYDPLHVGQQPAPVTRPLLTLEGIVWDGGASPTAVLEGLPTADGARVVRQGEVFGDVRVRAIGRDRVVIVGRDTTWTLSVREPWK